MSDRVYILGIVCVCFLVFIGLVAMGLSAPDLQGTPNAPSIAQVEGGNLYRFVDTEREVTCYMWKSQLSCVLGIPQEGGQ